MEKPNNHITLAKLHKKEVLKAPEGYFEQLPYTIQARVAKPKSIREKLIAAPVLVKWVPASLVVLLLAFFYWGNTNDPPTYEDLLAEVTDEEIVDYLYLEDFSTYEIMNQIEQNDSISFNENTTDAWLNELSDTELKNIINNYDYDTSVHYY